MRNLWLLFLVGLVATVLTEKVPTTPLDDMYLEGRTSGDFPVDDEDGDDGGSGSGSGDDNWMVQEEKVIRMTDFFRTTQSSDVDGAARQQTTVPSATAAPSQRPTTLKDLKSPDAVTDGASEAEEGANVEPTADWFTQEPTRPSQTSSTAPRNVDEVDEVDEVENNSLDMGTVAPTMEAEDVLPTGELENEIVASDGRGRMYGAGRATGEDVTSENMWERKEVLAAVIACGVVGFLCAVLLLTLLAYRLKKKDEGSYDLGDTKLTNTQYQKAPTKEFYA
ncbi:uncharacterized protein LOC142898253 [Nelusetta ayraudi]|uniref:uncharacterized protein LOC142898253 n=1 Tax=Nelusetta ayraudi TaxID=303726 RepID=UPI003F6FB23A